jgi:hypothetical protein
MLTKHKKNAGISKKEIFHHAKMYSSKKSSKRNQNPSRYIITLELISSFNTSQKSHLSKIK